MTTGVPVTNPIPYFTDNQGHPAAGGSVLTQVGGINAATFSDVGLTTPLPNPIPINSRGEASTSTGVSTQIFLTPNTVYTFTLKDKHGNVLSVATYVDGVQVVLTQANIGAALFPQTAAENAAGVTPVNFFYVEGDARRYGVTGNGVTDDTAALNVALTVNVPIIIHADMACKVSGPLTRAISMNGIWMQDGSSINPTGSGYTVLTITDPKWGAEFQLFVNMFNWSPSSGFPGRPALNGIHFQTALAGAFIPRIEVFGLAGFAVQIEAVFDSFVGVITTQGCGSASQAAIQINGSGGSDSNFTYFSDLQPENSFNLALTTQGVRGLHIGNIHIENPFTGGSDISFVNLIGDMVIDDIYWISTDAGNILINPSNISIGQITYSSQTGATNNYVQLNPGFTPSNCRIGLIQSLGGTYTLDLKETFVGAANLKYYVGGGNVGTLLVAVANWDVNNLSINTLNIGFSAVTYAAALQRILRRCNIASVVATTNTSSCTFEDSTIAAATTMPGFSVFRGGQINGALTLNNQGILARDLYISGAVSMTSPTLWDWERVHVVGNVTYGGTTFRHTHRSVQIDGTTDSHLLAAPGVSPSAITDAPYGNVHERTQWVSSSPIGWKWNGSAWVAGPNAP